jgi:hypothetical protein
MEASVIAKRILICSRLSAWAAVPPRTGNEREEHAADLHAAIELLERLDRPSNAGWRLE